MPSNDNDQDQPPLAPGQGESHGRAALLLVESLIHGLCESEKLSVNEAIAIAERAADVQQDHAEEADGAGAPLWHAHSLLMNIKTSLAADEGDASPRPR